MKIIRKGRLPAGSVYYGTCRHCDCDVEVDKEEVAEFNCGQDYYDGVRCPTPGCKRVIEVRPWSFPPLNRPY